jgi:hypothetical protein
MWLHNDVNRIHNRNDSSLSDRIIYKNDKERLVELCLRNAFKFAVGEIKYTKSLGDQLKFAFENSNQPTRDLMISVFRNRGFLEGLE